MFESVVLYARAGKEEEEEACTQLGYTHKSCPGWRMCAVTSIQHSLFTGHSRDEMGLWEEAFRNDTVSFPSSRDFKKSSVDSRAQTVIGLNEKELRLFIKTLAQVAD